MKIGTDAVLLGAWVKCENESRILDIGTGTGILALMMAQRNPIIQVDAVELEEDAARLAEQNINLSPWKERIIVYNTTIQEFAGHKKHRYSLILCNPPFFADSLKSVGKARNLARHNDSLPVTDLLRITSQLLCPHGRASFILPAQSFEYWKLEAEKFTLFPQQLSFVRSTPEHKPHRVLVTFTTNSNSLYPENELSIYTSSRAYSKDYQELTKDFYLHF